MITVATIETVLTEGAAVIALGLVAGLAVFLVAAGYRWYLHRELPYGIGLLTGAGIVAVWLNTTVTLGQAIGGTTNPVTVQAAGFTVGSFAAAAVLGELGRRGGDSLGTTVLGEATLTDFEHEVKTFVSGRGRIHPITLPDEVVDLEGYEPIRDDLKRELEGTTISLPGRLSERDRRHALLDYLEERFNVGTADLEFDDAGNVSHLAVGRRPVGIGHTLPAGQVATVVRADPAFSASPGDRVTVWRDEDSLTRIGTAELRGVAGEYVTLAIDASDREAFAPETGYRIETLPQGPQPSRTFAAVLRRVHETIKRTTITEEGPLAGAAVGSLEATVLSVTDEDGTITPLPADDVTLAPGQTILAMGRPDVLRRFKDSAQGSS